jgi:hypothetical protein
VITLATPVIYHRKLDQRNRKTLDHDVLKDPHKRDLIPHLDPDVVAKKRVDKL